VETDVWKAADNVCGKAYSPEILILSAFCFSVCDEPISNTTRLCTVANMIDTPDWIRMLHGRLKAPTTFHCTFFSYTFFEVPCVFVYRGIPHPKLKVGGGDAATMGEAHPDKIFLFWLSDMLVQSEYYKSDAVHKLLSCFPFFCHNYQHAHVEMSKSRRLLFPLIKSSVVYSSVRVSLRRHEENQAEELG